jgi:hypothetical protein
MAVNKQHNIGTLETDPDKIAKRLKDLEYTVHTVNGPEQLSYLYCQNPYCDKYVGLIYFRGLHYVTVSSTLPLIRLGSALTIMGNAEYLASMDAIDLFVRLVLLPGGLNADAAPKKDYWLTKLAALPTDHSIWTQIAYGHNHVQILGDHLGTMLGPEEIAKLCTL